MKGIKTHVKNSYLKINNPQKISLHDSAQKLFIKTTSRLQVRKPGVGFLGVPHCTLWSEGRGNSRNRSRSFLRKTGMTESYIISVKLRMTKNLKAHNSQGL